MLLDRAVRYYRFAERWNWPPSVVDRESAILMSRLDLVASVADEITEERQRRAENG